MIMTHLTEQNLRMLVVEVVAVVQVEVQVEVAEEEIIKEEVFDTSIKY